MTTVKIGTVEIDENHLTEPLKKKLEEVMAAQLDAEKQKILSATAATKDPSVEATQKEIEQIKKDTELLGLKRKALEAALPATQTTALAGTISIDEKSFIEAAIVAYRQLDKVADLIANELKRLRPLRLIVYSERDAAALGAFASFQARAELLIREFEGIKTRTLPKAPEAFAFAFSAGMAISAAAVGLKSVADILALFRTDVEVKARAVPVGQEELVAALGRALTGHAAGSAHLIYPALVPLELEAIEDSPLLLTIKAVEERRDQARKLVGDRREDGSARDPDPELARQLASAEEHYLAFRTTLTAKEQAASSSFEMAFRGSELQRRLNDGHLLIQLKIVASGGSYLLTKNLFRGSRLRQSGGIVVSYIVVNNKAEIVAAGVHGQHGIADDLRL